MKRVKREVRNLILMLGSGVFAAFLVTVVLVYYFGSSGTHLVRNILVDPKAFEQSYDPKTSKEASFFFNKIEFAYAQSQGRGWGRFAVSPESYAQFCKKVSNLRSISVLTDDIIQQFEWIPPSTLTIFVNSRGSFEGPSKETLFQQVQFIDQGDVFRVQLPNTRHEDGGKQQWVYFSCQGIYKAAMELFAPTVQG